MEAAIQDPVLKWDATIIEYRQCGRLVRLDIERNGKYYSVPYKWANGKLYIIAPKRDLNMLIFIANNCGKTILCRTKTKNFCDGIKLR